MYEDIQVTSDTKRQFRVYTTLLEIVERRGYCVPDNKKFQSPRQFQRSKTEVQRQVFYLDQTDDMKNALGIHCNFDLMEVQQNFVAKYIDNFNSVNFDSVIFVVPVGKKQLDNEKQFQNKFQQQNSIRIQTFKQQDLLFNVLNHDLVPEHIILKEQQKKQILAYYKVKQNQLPKILVSDPVSRFLGLRKGQVVKIIRKSQTAGRYTTYRIAI